MSIIKNRLKNKFTTLPNEIIESSISHAAFRIYCYLISKPDGWTVLNEDIKKKLRIKDKESMSKYWKELIDTGWIIREQHVNELGKFSGGFDYQLNEHPIDVIGFLVESENTRIPEIPAFGKTPHSGNMRIHSNTDSYTNKESNSKAIKNSTISRKEIQEEDLASNFNSILDKFNKENGSMNNIPMNAQERTKFVNWLSQRVIDHPKLKNTDRALLNQITRMRDFENPRDANSVNSILDDTIRGNDKGVFQNILEPKMKVVRPRSAADEGIIL